MKNVYEDMSIEEKLYDDILKETHTVVFGTEPWKSKFLKGMALHAIDNITENNSEEEYIVIDPAHSISFDYQFSRDLKDLQKRYTYSDAWEEIPKIINRCVNLLEKRYR